MRLKTLQVIDVKYPFVEMYMKKLFVVIKNAFDTD